MAEEKTEDGTSMIVLNDHRKYNLVSGLSEILISAQTEKIGSTWSNGKVWDKSLIEKFYCLLKKKKGEIVVLDVGAQTGSFTLLAKYLPHSKWYAFEPISEAADQLKFNLSLNGIQNVSVIEAGVSDQAGIGVLKLPENAHWGLSTLGDQPIRFNQYKERTVQCISLDDFVKQNQVLHVDFIKIDTEGWELHVLQGARSLIKKARPVILMEFNEENMQQCQVLKCEVEQLLQDLGYEWEFVSSEDILCIPKVE